MVRFCHVDLKKLILKITWWAARKKTPLKQSFYPSVSHLLGRDILLPHPSSSFALLMQWEEWSILPAWKAERRVRGAPIHPGAFWRMHAHFWAMDCLPQQSSWTWNLQWNKVPGARREVMNPWNILRGSGPQVSPSERFSYQELTLFSRDPAGLLRTVGPMPFQQPE